MATAIYLEFMVEDQNGYRRLGRAYHLPFQNMLIERGFSDPSAEGIKYTIHNHNPAGNLYLQITKICTKQRVVDLKGGRDWARAMLRANQTPKELKFSPSYTEQ